MINPSSCFQRHPDVAWRLVQEDALLVDPRTGRIFPLNPVAARIWTLLEGSRRMSDIVEILINEFDASPDTVGNDAYEFIEKLLDANLLVPALGQGGKGRTQECPA
jgi:hypothetical protein